MDLEQLRVKLQSILSIISKNQQNSGLRALDFRLEFFASTLSLRFVHTCLTLLNLLQGHRPLNGCRRKVVC